MTSSEHLQRGERRRRAREPCAHDSWADAGQRERNWPGWGWKLPAWALSVLAPRSIGHAFSEDGILGWKRGQGYISLNTRLPFLFHESSESSISSRGWGYCFLEFGKPRSEKQQAGLLCRTANSKLACCALSQRILTLFAGSATLTKSREPNGLWQISQPAMARPRYQSGAQGRSEDEGSLHARRRGDVKS